MQKSSINLVKCAKTRTRLISVLIYIYVTKHVEINDEKYENNKHAIWLPNSLILITFEHYQNMIFTKEYCDRTSNRLKERLFIKRNI